MRLTVLPHSIIRHDLQIIKTQNNVPKLEDTHISLLKHDNKNTAVNAFEKFVLEKLNP
jgi:hypothetical protein